MFSLSSVLHRQAESCGHRGRVDKFRKKYAVAPKPEPKVEAKAEPKAAAKSAAKA